MFTLNNYSDEDLEAIRRLEVTYLVFGKEVAPTTGTPHLQGFVVFRSNKRLSGVRPLFFNRAHVSIANGTSVQAAEYCKKDGDFEEFGVLPNSQGKRTDVEKFLDWIKSHDGRPSCKEVIKEFPSLWLRSGDRLMDVVDAYSPKPLLTNGDFRQGWQTDLQEKLEGDPDSRVVHFVVDETGGCGKTWFCQKYLSTHDDVQVLRVGKRDDLAYCIDETKKFFFFDIPRRQLEYFQYSILEMLKDRLVFSPKYNSKMKILSSVPHVVVFCNEFPDMECLSEDRYDVVNVN